MSKGTFPLAVGGKSITGENSKKRSPFYEYVQGKMVFV
jgi:hypothetical protein